MNAELLSGLRPVRQRCGFAAMREASMATDESPLPCFSLLWWVSKAFVHECAGDLLAVLFGHAFTTRNGVPPCTHTLLHFIDDARSFFALE